MGLNRTARSIQEIASLPDLSGPDCAEHLRDHGDSLCAETLVYLLRECERLGVNGLVETCGRLLVGSLRPDGRYTAGHCEGVIIKAARSFGFIWDEDLRTEFRGQCHEKMWKAIRAGREAKPFWEERFSRALSDLAIDVGRSMLAQMEALGIDDFAEGPEVPPDPPDDDGEDAWVAEMAASELRDAIRRLPEKERQVMWLRWVEDLPVTDSDGPSITSVLGISDSMVRRYERLAKERLRTDPVVLAIRDSQW